MLRVSAVHKPIFRLRRMNRLPVRWRARVRGHEASSVYGRVSGEMGIVFDQPPLTQGLCGLNLAGESLINLFTATMDLAL